MKRPRVGFIGLGWIGRNRMDAMLATGAIEAVAVADTSEAACREAAGLASGVVVTDTLADLLAVGVDGVVIATPSALHADQSIAALEAGAAVFCQKPLGRTAAEVARVGAAARAADRLLAVDFSYRHTQAIAAIKALVKSGALGRVHAVDLVFHNAYGPDKPWFYDLALSGGGCVMDLGVHLIDLALWTMGFPEVTGVAAHLSAGGERLGQDSSGARVEDFCNADLLLATGTVVRLTCSWRLHAGCDAVIAARFYGSEGGAVLRNIEGSFYDFTAEHTRNTTCQGLVSPPDAWGGRAAAQWAYDLAEGARVDRATVDELMAVAVVIDRIYAAAQVDRRL